MQFLLDPSYTYLDVPQITAGFLIWKIVSDLGIIIFINEHVRTSCNVLEASATDVKIGNRNRKFCEYLCKIPPKKRSKRRCSQETERMCTRARSPEVDELSCVPETQQAAGVEELVVGMEDPLEMSDTEQGDIGLETQHESDTSDEDT